MVPSNSGTVLVVDYSGNPVSIRPEGEVNLTLSIQADKLSADSPWGNGLQTKARAHALGLLLFFGGISGGVDVCNIIVIFQFLNELC